MKLFGATLSTVLGYIAVAWTDAGIGYSCLPENTSQGSWEQLVKQTPGVLSSAVMPRALAAALSDWEQGDDRLLFNLPLACPQLDRSSFATRVCLALRRIPRGQARTYGWIASAAGNPRAARAAGQALAANPLPLLLPCHRIVQAGGKLGGFRGSHQSAALKTQLLTWEGVKIKNGLVYLDQDGAGYEHG